MAIHWRAVKNSLRGTLVYLGTVHGTGKEERSIVLGSWTWEENWQETFPWKYVHCTPLLGPEAWFCLYTHWNWRPGELKVQGIEMRFGVRRGYPAKIGWLGLSVHCRSQSKTAAVNTFYSLMYLESLYRVIRTYSKTIQSHLPILTKILADYTFRWSSVTIQYISTYIAVVKNIGKVKIKKSREGEEKANFG